MGLHARPTAQKSAQDSLQLSNDVEAADDHLDKTQRTTRVWRARLIPSFVALSLLVFWLATTSAPLEFPFPKPSPEPSKAPRFIKEGIKQCKIIARSPPNPKAFTDKRETNDRFVKGTKATWLKNATLWTGEKGGSEILYGANVLLDGGVIRKISKGDKLEDLVGLLKSGVDEVELNGAWVTPGGWTSCAFSGFHVSIFARAYCQESSICTLISRLIPPPSCEGQTIPTRSNRQSCLGFDL